jgi:hypothetical protein
MTEHNHSAVATREKVAETLRVGGWLAFWVQLVLLATSAVILLFAIAFRLLKQLHHP